MGMAVSDPRANRRGFPLWGVLSGAWFALIVLASFVPEGWKTRFHFSGRFHLPLHFAVFAFSAFLLCGFLRPAGRRILGCMAVIAFAFLSEMLESRVFGNNLEWGDIVADICGVLTALLLVVFASPKSGDQEMR